MPTATLDRKDVASDRISALPPYLFVELDRAKRKLAEQGREIFDLGIGDPDIPTPDFVIQALAEAARDPSTHRYPDGAGLPEYRQACARFYQERFGVTLDPESEVLSLIGSKEGVGHLPLAVVNPGDVVLVPDPGYPGYRSGTLFAGGVPYVLPLRRDNAFLPDLGGIPESILRQTRLLWLNYPNNPTGAVAPAEFFRQAVQLAAKYGFIVAHDAPYSEIVYDGKRAMSILEIEGAREVAVELHSFSKIFNMTGWRAAFAVGRRDVIASLGKIKNNLDSGIFAAVQRAGVAALARWREVVESNMKVYQERRDLIVSALKGTWELCDFPSTFYGWIALSPGVSSGETSKKLLEETGVVLTPGRGFGTHGEGFLRLSITAPTEKLRAAGQRLASARPPGR